DIIVAVRPELASRVMAVGDWGLVIGDWRRGARFHPSALQHVVAETFDQRELSQFLRRQLMSRDDIGPVGLHGGDDVDRYVGIANRGAARQGLAGALEIIKQV